VDERRIIASIRQASSEFDVPDISSIEIGTTVAGIVSEIHKDNILLILQPTSVRALLSVKNLANHRSQTVAQLRTALQAGEKFEELVVVSKNPEKGLVIVANRPKSRPSLLVKGSNVTIESIKVGQLIGGRVTKHIKNGALVKITSHIGGVLHFTDLSDNFDLGAQLPGIDSIIKAAVVGINISTKQLALSTRSSRIHADQSHEVVDREIDDLSQLEVGQSVRGFVKNVMEHGLFVTVGRDIDARVQIRELFNEALSYFFVLFSTSLLLVLVCQRMERTLQGRSDCQGPYFKVGHIIQLLFDSWLNDT
jgi:rRNA biogenesis protein RRP5